MRQPSAPAPAPAPGNQNEKDPVPVAAAGSASSSTHSLRSFIYSRSSRNQSRSRIRRGFFSSSPSWRCCCIYYCVGVSLQMISSPPSLVHSFSTPSFPLVPPAATSSSSRTPPAASRTLAGDGDGDGDHPCSAAVRPLVAHSRLWCAPSVGDHEVAGAQSPPEKVLSEMDYRRRIMASAKAKDAKSAVEALVDMKRCSMSPSTGCYAGVIRACSAAGEASNARFYFDEMVARGILPTAEDYTAAMIGCLDPSTWSWADQLLREMRARGVQLDGGVYGAAVKAAGMGRNYVKATQLLRQASAQGVAVPRSAFASTLRTCVDTSKPGEAEKVLSDMRRVFKLDPSPSEYNIVIDAYLKAKSPAKGLEVYEAYKSPENSPDSATYALLLRAAEMLGDKAMAEALKDQIKLEGGKLSTAMYNCIISACNHAHDHVTALAHAKQMKRDRAKPNSRTYSEIIKAHANKSPPQWEQALANLNRMEQLGMMPNIRCYNWGVAACARAEQWRMVEQLMERLDVEFQGPNQQTFSSLLGACAAMNDARRTAEYIDLAKSRGIKLNDSMYSKSMAVFHQSGKDERAVKLYQEMRTDKAMAKPSPRTLQNALVAASSAQNWGAADQIIVQMQDVGFKSHLTREYLEAKKDAPPRRKDIIERLLANY